METKFIKIYLFLLIIFNIHFVNAQNADNVKIKDITIDSLSLNDARYRLIDFGQIITKKNWTQEYEEYSRNYTETNYDSIVVLSYKNSRNKTFVDWIKIVGSKHIIRINNNFIQVNDSISIIEKIYPFLYNEYINFIITKNKKNNTITFWGTPIIIDTYDNSKGFYLGSLKFGICNGVIREIIFDLRPDGEYD